MKRTGYKVKFQGKEYTVIYVDFKRKLVHIVNNGDVKNVGFKDISVNYKIFTEFKDSKSEEVFVGDIVKLNGSEYVVSNSPHLIPKGFDEEKATKKKLTECEVIHYE